MLREPCALKIKKLSQALHDRYQE